MENVIKNLQRNLKWDIFLLKMEEEGFIIKNFLTFSQISNLNSYKKQYLSGNVIFVNNRIQSGCIRDPSYLSLCPYILIRPMTESQLKKIIIHSQALKIPITFAGGKTGLSGGYSNFGIVVDLADLHSFKVPFSINFDEETIIAEQSALVPDLIKHVQYLSGGKYIFPVQPASALNLPVRVGGLISSNASGVTSGKLGSVENWIISMRIMTPNGSIIEIGVEDSLSKKIIGGNGYFGIVLSAIFKLYKPLEDSKQAIIFGDKIELAFNGLQTVLESRIFPLISEFVVSPEKLPGKFDLLSQKPKWAVLIKGTSEEIDDFISIMFKETNCFSRVLTEEEFQEYLQERSIFALLVQTSDSSADYIAFPGFEDILSQPKNLPEIINTINNIFDEHGFHKVIFGYGHINFRKGKGLLLHMRLPVPIEYFYKGNEKMLDKVIETIYELIITLKKRFKVIHKAEHSPGVFPFFLDENFRNNYRNEIKKGSAFINPHLMLYDYVSKNIKNQIIDKEKQIFLQTLKLYLLNL